MIDEHSQPDEQKSSRIMRLFLRAGLTLLAAGVVGAIVYAVLGAIRPVNLARFSISPTNISLQDKQKFTIEVNLDTAGRVVGAVELHVQYRADLFEDPTPAAMRPGPVWGNPQVVRSQVNQNVGTILDANNVARQLNEVELVISRPSPGISSPRGDSVTAALVDFVVRLPVGTPASFAATTNISFDSATTKVIIDDFSGNDILDHSPQGLRPATYTVFARIPGSCASGTFECDSRLGQTCPSSARAQDLDPSDTLICCNQQCAGPVPLTIVESSITEAFTTDTSVSPEEAVAVITWRTLGPAANSTVCYSSSGIPSDAHPPAPGTTCVTSNEADQKATANHRVTLRNLSIPPPVVTYQYFVKSQSFSADTPPQVLASARSIVHSFDFDPASFDQALAITDVGFQQRSSASGVLSWNTTAPANYNLKVYEGNVIGAPLIDERSNTCNPALLGSCSVTHSERLSNLKPNVLYTCEITAAGEAAKLKKGSTAALDRAQCTFSLVGGGIGFDANTILKVDLDRECDSWLSCTSSLSAKDRFEQSQEMCFALGVCDAINPATGACVQLKKTVSATNQVRIVKGQPNQSTVDAVRTSSGNAKVGIRWEGFLYQCSGGNRDGQICDPTETASCGTGGSCVVSNQAQVVPGIVPYSNLLQVGGGVAVPNATFEADSVFPWKEYPDASAVSVTTEFAAGSGKLDLGTGGRALAAKRTAGPANAVGVSVSLGINPFVGNVPYYVAFDIKANRVSGKNSIAGTAPKLQVQLLSTGSRTVSLGSQDIPFSTGWQTVVAGPFLVNSVPAGDGVFLRFVNLGAQNAVESFLLDNVSVKPVLLTGGGNLIPRVCRAYPGQTSPACDYFDPLTGKNFRGWQGYCLQRDPKDQEQCIQWWPTDIISGTASIFSSDEVAGYLNGGRFPLYYCTGARGNYPYIRSHGDLICGAIPDAAGLSGGTDGMVYDCNETFRLEDKQGQRIRESSLAYLKADLSLQSNYPNEDRVHSQSTLFLSKATDWAAWTLTGDEGRCPTNLTTWDQVKKFMEGQCTPGCDAYGLQYVFKNDLLEKVELGLCENTGSGSGRLRWNGSTYYMNEQCDILTQVVNSDGENRAYSSRLKSNTKYSIDGLGYTYRSDYLPFGAAVHPIPDNNPSQWGLLSIEPPNTQFAFSEPFQARAGQPYGFSYLQKESRCLHTGNSCSSSFDCDPTQLGVCNNTNILVPGVCIYNGVQSAYSCTTVFDCPNRCAGISPPKLGPRTCIYGDSGSIGKECTLNEECGFGDSGQTGLCAGAELGIKATGWDQVNQTLAPQFGFIGTPPNPLTKLFAKTYGTWVWNGTDYTQACAENGVAVCTAGVNGVNQGNACKSQSDCCAGGVTTGCSASCGVNNTASCSFRGNSYGWDVTGTQGIPPSVGAIRVNGLPKLLCEDSVCFEGSPGQLPSAIQGIGVFPVSLSFTSDVSQDQRGLVSYIVDWGDGEVISEGNLSIEPKADVKNPHAFGHVYQYHSPEEYFPAGCIRGQTCAGNNRDDRYQNHGCDATECRYQIRVQIRDNWDWCNARVATNGKFGFFGSDCRASNDDAWDYFGATAARVGVPVVVRRPP